MTGGERQILNHEGHEGSRRNSCTEIFCSWDFRSLVVLGKGTLGG